MLDTTDDWRAGGRRSVVAAALWRSRWLIAVIVVLAGLVGYLISSLMSPVYTAQTRLVLATTQNFDPLGRPVSAAANRYVANQLAIIESRPVLELALEELGADASLSVEELRDAIAVAAPADTDIIEVAVTGPTPEAAAARASAVVGGYRTFVLEQVQDEADAAAEAVATSPQAVVDIRTRAAVFGDGVAVVEEPVVPSSPTSPRPLRDSLLAMALGGLVAVGIALVRRDDAVEQEATDVADALDAPFLGSAPILSSRWRRRRLRGNELEMPLVALDYAVAGRPGAVLVTGLPSTVGAEALVLGLAEVAARSRRVVVVDADPGSRRLLRLSGAAEVNGLDESRPDPDVRRLVSPVPGTGRAPFDLTVLGSGYLHRPGAAEIARRNLSLLVEHYDLVLVSAGPVTEDALAFALLREVGAVVLAVGGRSTLDTAEVVAAQEQLTLAGRECDGLVLITRRTGRRAVHPSGGSALPPALAEARSAEPVHEQVPTRR